MSDESPTTESLIQQLGRLNAEVARRRQKARALRGQREALARERDELRAQREALAAERDAFRQRLEAEPSALEQENQRLRSELRTRDHKEVFQRLATRSGVRPEAVEDLWRLSGYQPEADRPDEAQLQGLVESAREGRPYLFQPPAEAGPSDRPAPAPTRPPGPGLSRGVPDPSSGGLVARQSQLRDPHWMRYHQDLIAEASRKGQLTILPD
jgi:hypothetical protein